MIALQYAMLWIHLFAAVIFVGGSFFMWLVVVPASKMSSEDESERTMIIGLMAKRFGRISDISLALLIITGLYNATWYLPSQSSLFTTLAGEILFAKSILVLLLIVLIFVNNLYFGRKIVRLAKERRIEELSQLRGRSRALSMLNLSLMTAILLLAVLMQFY